MKAIKYTLLTATRPNCVTKRYWLDGNELKKAVSAEITEGELQIREISSAKEFADALQRLGTDQCHIYGVPPNDAQLVTQKKWVSAGRPKDSLPRTNEVFGWPAGPGVMLLDIDAPKEGKPAMTNKAAFELLLKVCPTVNGTDLIWWPSASSHIFHGDKDLTGLRGQRIYLFVSDTSDIERAGKVLNERLWAMGHGSYEVSASGSLLKRSVFDGSVWSQSHIDFAAGAKCEGELHQARGAPLVIGEEEFSFLDTKTALPDLSPIEVQQAQQNQEHSKSLLTGQAEQQRASWVVDRITSMKARNPALSDQQAQQVVRRAIENRELAGDYEIIVIATDGSELKLSVAEVLQLPDKYDGSLTLDPHEPDYDGRRPVGKLFLSGGRPNLYSFAHGGTNYRLLRNPSKLQLVEGKTHIAIDGLLEILREAPDVFDFGNQLVQIGDAGSLLNLTEHSLKYVSGGLVQFFYEKVQANGTRIQVLRDPPSGVCKPIVDLKGMRRLKALTAVITGPTLRPDGSLLLSPGFDKSTGLFFEHKNGRSSIKYQPSIEEAQLAIDELWKPFKDFPFCSAIDRAVHLAALLTAAVRASLPTAPGFAYDAPIQGSGKTLLARCVGVMATGLDPGIWPHTTTDTDEEVRKRLFTVLCSGARVLIWDNVIGVFDSAALASCLTSTTYQDRILGKTDSSTVPNRMLLLLTGNNIVFQGELPRRILVSRIDPQTDKPFAREFDVDPFSYCKANRQSMIAAALTLIRAMVTHGTTSQVSGKLASFEEWDQWVRRAVIFADELRPGRFGDVMEVVKANQSVDPEQETLLNLLSTWHAIFGSSPVTAADVLAKCQSFPAPISGPVKLLNDALSELPLRSSGRINSKSLGRYLGFRKDRRAGGYCLREGPRTNDKNTWRVVRLDTALGAGGI